MQIKLVNFYINASSRTMRSFSVESTTIVGKFEDSRLGKFHALFANAQVDANPIECKAIIA